MRLVFLDPAARDAFPEFDGVAQETVATLRAAAGADLDDPRLAELVGELSLKSDEFRRLWARHDVREKASGTKRMLHPMVGELVARLRDAARQRRAGAARRRLPRRARQRVRAALALLGAMAAEQAVPAVATTV